MNFRIKHSSFAVIIFALSGLSITILLLLSTLLLAQEGHNESVDNANTPRGNITGTCVSHDGSPLNFNPLGKPKEAQLYNVLMQKKAAVAINKDGSFSFNNLNSGEYILNIISTEYYDHTIILLLGENESKDIGEQRLLPYPTYPSFWVGEINIGVPFPIDLDSQYPRISGHTVLTVCEYLKMRANYQLMYTFFNRVIIIGNLVQTLDGNWLQQSCGNPVKTGVHSWTDAIFLGDNIDDIHEIMSGIETTINNNNNVLKEVDKSFGKEFIQNNNNSDSVAVAVIGTLITRDNLVYVKCGEEKTCGFGYGPIAAPAQIEYWQMRHLNQDDVNKR